MKQNFIISRLLVMLLFTAILVPCMEVIAMNTMKLSSPGFTHNGVIPSKYTCDGADVNPALMIETVPGETKSLALIMDDPDAPRGTWVHWVVWNIDPKTTEIGENTVPSGAKQGMNDFRRKEYGGPCPPSGTHRYYFKVYALDAVLDLDERATKAKLEAAMKDHIIGRCELIGLYSRK